MKKLYVLPVLLGLVFLLTQEHAAEACTYPTNQNSSYNPSQSNNMYQLYSYRQSNEQQLQTLLEQHATVGAQTFIAQYNHDPNLPSLQQQVNTNMQQLTDFFNSYMGQSAAQQFQQLWQRHINDLSTYTDATKNGDANAKQQAQQDLNGFVNDFTNFFLNQTNNQGQNNQYISQFQQMMQMHINDEESIIDAHASGNDTQVSYLMQQGSMHADMMAQLMWQILMQNNQNNQPTY